MSEARSVPPLRIAVLANFESVHSRRWLEAFVQRGHEMHAISYYQPSAPMPGVHLHVLSGAQAPSGDAGASEAAPSAWPSPRGRGSKLRQLLPPSAERLIHARRYLRAGLRRVLDEIEPDVFHAHYAVEHGFYGSFAGYRPYVVSTWGSDLLVESRKPFGRLIARRALSRADLVTANDVSLAQRARELGVPEDRIEVVHLGIERGFLDAGERSVNLRAGDEAPLTVISDRALEPLYNVDVIIRAFARVRERVPAARIVVAHDGGERERLQALVRSLGLDTAVQFVGRLAPEALAAALSQAHVYVSVPSSDSMALSTVEAMGAGAFPIVSALPSNAGWITDGDNGLVVPPGDVEALAAAMQRALTDAELRGNAIATNRAKVEAAGLRERNMLLMERHYYRLAGHPQAGGGEAI